MLWFRRRGRHAYVTVDGTFAGYFPSRSAARSFVRAERDVDKLWLRRRIYRVHLLEADAKEFGGQPAAQ